MAAAPPERQPLASCCPHHMHGRHLKASSFPKERPASFPTKRRGLLAYHEALQAGRKKWAQDNWQGPWLNGKSVQTSSVQTLQNSWWLPPHERDEMLTDINRQARGPPGRGRGHTPATSSWAMDFLTRKGESRKSIHHWLRDRKIPWQRRRRLIQVMANCFPTGSYLALIGQKSSAHCEPFFSSLFYFFIVYFYFVILYPSSFSSLF